MSATEKQKRFGFPRSLRLIKTSDFGVLARTRSEKTLHVRSAFFSAGCMITNAAGRLRFGVTVGKRNAHRSVDRVVVKRILREAARHHAPELRALIDEASCGLDVSLRLRVPLGEAGAQSAHQARKKALGEDVEALFGALIAKAGPRIRKAAEKPSCRSSSD